MSPPYFFQIDEIVEHSHAQWHTDERGHWKPSIDPGANIDFTAGVGVSSVSSRQWFCDGQQIREVAPRPDGAQLYKTFSVYYVGGVGFWVLKGDARQPPNDDDWHHLQFWHYTTNQPFSSYLTNVGQHSTLWLQPQDQRWANLLLPTIYHTHKFAPSQDYGGIVGELPIFLALIAFTTSRENLPYVLPHTFVRGAWAPTHNWQLARIDKRGVVVKVYTCPASYSPNMPQGSTTRELNSYEMGGYGKYFN